MKTLTQNEINNISGGDGIREVYGAAGTIIGMAAVYYILDPLISYLRKQW